MAVDSSDMVDIQTLDRFVNVLSCVDKRKKIAALGELKKIVGKAEGDLILEVHDKLQNQLILLFQDPVEIVREAALNLSRLMIEKMDVDKSRICLLMPALYPRVCREKDHEASEELRLNIAAFLTCVVEKYGREVAPYTMEMVDMVCRLLNDPSPDIKQATSQLLITLVTSLPQETYGYTKKLWPPLVINLDHRRWRVRVASVEAIESLMLTGDNKLVPEVTPALNKKMLDPMYQVRLALVRLAGHWMVRLPDRYSFFAHLIPILLSGLADENNDVTTTARLLWDTAGDVYLKENDTEFKDKINYEPDVLDHYPSGIQRPNLGCRILIEREATKFLLALVHELTDWVEIVRIKASILLVQVILHFERSITMSIRKIITQICKAAQDKETPQVVRNVKSAAEIMGYFVPASTYCKLIIEYMKEAREGELLVVAALIRGTQRSQLVDHLEEISTLMEHITFKGCEQLALLDLIESVIEVSKSDCIQIGNCIWSSLVSVAGLAENEKIRECSIRLLEDFAQFSGGNKRKFFGQFCSPLLKKLTQTVWTVHCQEQFILTAVINVSGEIIADNLNEIIDTFSSALKPDNDPEVLLKVAMSVNDLLANQEVSLPTEEAMGKFVQALLSQILPPLLKWSPGRSAEAIRTVASTCLYICLCKLSQRNVYKILTTKPVVPQKNVQAEEVENVSPAEDESSQGERATTIHGLDNYFEPLFPLILSLMQDPAHKTRLLALNCIQLLASVPMIHTPQHFSTLISQSVKRLDDADTKVRLTSIQILKTCYERHIEIVVPEEVNRTLVDFVYSTLLIHLDDKDPQLKQSVFECLQTVSAIDPISLRRKISPLRFRDQEICQHLMDFVEEKIENIKL